MPRKNIKRPRLNSRKKIRNRHYAELDREREDLQKGIANMAFELKELEQVFPSFTAEDDAPRRRKQEGSAVPEGGTVEVPPPTQDQIDYVAALIKHREDSFDPNKVIGGPDPNAPVEALKERLESLDGSDTQLLDELRAGGHPIATEDAEGNLIIEETSKPVE